MAARLRAKHQDDVRTKIQTSQLINRLQNHALGTSEIELTSSQLKAIEILLRKSIPDLSSVQMDANVDGSLTVQIIKYGDNPITK